MASEVHVADVGTIIRLTIKDAGSVVNVSGATTKQIWMRKPFSPGSTPTVLTKPASFYTDGSDGIIQYTTIAGDLDTAGEWSVQAYVVSASGSWHSDVIPMRVYPNVQ